MPCNVPTPAQKSSAIDPEAAMFYRKYGFESCPGFELHLMLLMKDVRASLGL